MEISKEACVQSALSTKCSYQQKQTCFCWEEKSLHNEVSQPHAIVYKHSGAPSGGPTFFFQQRAGKTASSLANFWLERASQLCFLLSSHNYPNTELLAAPMCSVYQATWTCIWSARVCRPVNSTARWMCINNGVLCVKITSGKW